MISFFFLYQLITSNTDSGILMNLYSYPWTMTFSTAYTDGMSIEGETFILHIISKSVNKTVLII